MFGTLRKSTRKKEKKSVGLRDFEILHIIGKGAFGKVLKVRLIETNEIFAMKLLRKEDILRFNDLQHTIAEREILNELSNHPFVTSK